MKSGLVNMWGRHKTTQRALDNAADVELASARLARAETAETVTLDAVLDEFGVTREELLAEGDR